MLDNSYKSRVAYIEKIKKYRSTAEAILSEERDIILLINEGKTDIASQHLHLAEQMLNYASLYLVINGISVSIMYIRNDDALNKVRKALTKCIKYLEEIVTDLIDVPFSQYEKHADKIISYSPENRYILIRKIGLTIKLLKHAMGDESRNKWVLSEMECRYAVVAKNMINLRHFYANADQESSLHEPTVLLLHLVKTLLLKSAEQYREKYEYYNRAEDLRSGITYLSTLKRLDIITGYRREEEEIKKMIELWHNKLFAD